MKQHFVKTSNFERFMAGVRAVENRGSAEACILYMIGGPGTGKSTTVDHWGASTYAVYLDAIPGMNLTYVREYLEYQTATSGETKFKRHQALIEFFKRSRYPIVLDEAQHGLPNKAEVIEYLRRIAERAEVPLVLICHTSERSRFAKEHLAHITTRVAAVVEMEAASLDDCGLYLNELCEVSVDNAVVAELYKQSGGRYRLMSNATKTLEAIAQRLNKTSLTIADIKGMRLCEDAMKSLQKAAVR